MPGLANKLMEGLEEISDGKNCYFVDLFVRVSNKIAINFYHKLGYTVYRTVLQYYSGDNDEDAYDMRKVGSISKMMPVLAFSKHVSICTKLLGKHLLSSFFLLAD